MKKLAIFDMDGTLLDSLGDIARCSNKALEELGLEPYPVDDFRKFVGGGVAVLIERIFANRENTPENIQRFHDRYVELYNYVCAHESSAFPGILDMLRNLKAQGVITAVATNKPDAMCKMVLEDAFPGCIDIAYGQREDIAKKPDPEVVFRIMQDAGVEDKADVIYVGDSDVDIYTGLNAGVDTVGVLWGFRDKAELAGAGAPILCATNEELYNTIISK
jgi:phosphoglycolate phosphatase